MKRLLLSCLFFLLASVMLGCSTTEKDIEGYYVLVVEGEQNISDEFGKFVSNEYSVIETEYLMSLKVAKEKYPEYEIEKTPAVFIFETGGGEMKKLTLKTYNVNKAVQFLEETKIK